MKIRPNFRIAIINLRRFWNRRLIGWRLCKAEAIEIIKFGLEPFHKLIKPIQIQNQSNSENPINPPPVMAAEHRPENQKQTEKTWENLTKWGKFKRIFRVLEGIGLLSGIIAVCVVYDQLQEMKATRMTDERAWVMLSQYANANFDIDPITQARVGVSFNIGFKNSGRTPAINVVPNFAILFSTNQIDSVDIFPNPVYHSFLMSPNVEQVLPTQNFAPHAQVYDAITNGQTIYLAGTIWYDDIFGKHHWSKFCIIPNRDFSAWSDANFHNTCDDAKTSQP